METVGDGVGNEEVRDEEFQSRNTADPVLYQLVRVDGNGRLVPATDDEVTAVEDLFEDDKCIVRSTDASQTVGCNINYGSESCCAKTAKFEGSGQPQMEARDVGEEKQIMSSHPEIDYIEVDVKHEDKISELVRNTIDGSVFKSGTPNECPKLLDISNKSVISYKAETSTSPVGTDLKPDFSLLNGEIQLDNLSVKDLQETFQATFGRKTSVKDKQWLKRRIIMGLTNSCDFSTTALVIIDNRVIKKCKDGNTRSIDNSALVDCVVTSASETDGSLTTSHDKQIEAQPIGNAVAVQSSVIQYNCESNDTDPEQRSIKRVRKPTRRFIEELSDGESRDSGSQNASLVEHRACDQPSAEVCVGSIKNFGLDRMFLTRKDSLGGCGVQIPYVSRIRRSRPRENFMSLMPVAYSEGCTLEKENKSIQLENEVKPKNKESLNANCDDEAVTVPTANGGMRRKHHRPWKLGEVLKLVEGVAKCGAGRWSEIKRLAFASYSYRTSVDLKDKWRNLLRASMAGSLTGNGMQSPRKQASVPIPAQILSRVRELSDMQTQVPAILSSGKVDRHNDSKKPPVHVVDVQVSCLE